MLWHNRSARTGRSKSGRMKPLHRPARNACSMAAWIFSGRRLVRPPVRGRRWDLRRTTSAARRCSTAHRAMSRPSSKISSSAGGGSGWSRRSRTSRRRSGRGRRGIAGSARRGWLPWIEMMVEAAGQNPCGIGDLLHRRAGQEAMMESAVWRISCAGWPRWRRRHAPSADAPSGRGGMKSSGNRSYRPAPVTIAVCPVKSIISGSGSPSGD